MEKPLDGSTPGSIHKIDKWQIPCYTLEKRLRKRFYQVFDISEQDRWRTGTGEHIEILLNSPTEPDQLPYTPEPI